MSLNTHAYTSLLNVWQRIGDWEKAQGVFGNLTDSGLPVDSKAYGSMLGAYQRSADGLKNMQVFASCSHSSRNP